MISIWLLIILPGLISSSPVVPPSIGEASLSSRQDNDQPCERLSDLVSDGNNLLPPDLTLACLRSVPLARQDDALQLVGLRAFVQFQSDLEYLRDPPPGHIYPAVDILHGLEALNESLANGTYDNEYDFQLDIFKLLSSAYDGHLSYVPDIVGIFSFDRLRSTDTGNDEPPDLFSLFSISTDGTKLPDVYAYSDAAAIRVGSSSEYQASPIIHVDGEDVETWLNSYASQNGILSDPDANYNYLFRNIPGISSPGNRGDLFAASRYYQGNATTLAFANGTEAQTVNVARLMANQTLEGVVDGASFFRKFCNASFTEKLKEAVEPTSTSPDEPVITTQGPYEPIQTNNQIAPPSNAYPSPIAALSDGSISGYFPSSQDDLAVLAIPSFLTSAQQYVEFENTVRQVLATANANDKTKLVIDLRGNPGGALFLPYDIFRQLFPSLTPYGAANYRTHELFDFTGRVFSENAGDGLAGSPALAAFENGIALIPFDYHQALTQTNGSFNSWEDLYGPANTYNGGGFTSLVRFNLTEAAEANIPIYGYANNTAPQPQTFDAENIILLHDGVCSSACAIFSEFMESQAGVRSIVVGGRRLEGAMQGVGGTKGAQVLTMLQLYALVAGAGDAASLQEQAELLESQGSDLLDGATMALSRTSNILEANVNFRNNIRQDDDSVTPLQFVYEAADCRFFYTAEMYDRQELIWDRAYQWAWGNDTVCIPGSTGQKSASDGVSYLNSEPPEEATNFFGGNRTVFPSDTLGSAVDNNKTSSATGTNGHTGGDQRPSDGQGNDDGDGGTSAAISLSPGLLVLLACTFASMAWAAY